MFHPTKNSWAFPGGGFQPSNSHYPSNPRNTILQYAVICPELALCGGRYGSGGENFSELSWLRYAVSRGLEKFSCCVGGCAWATSCSQSFASCLRFCPRLSIGRPNLLCDVMYRVQVVLRYMEHDSNGRSRLSLRIGSCSILCPDILFQNYTSLAKISWFGLTLKSILSAYAPSLDAVYLQIHFPFVIQCITPTGLQTYYPH